MADQPHYDAIIVGGGIGGGALATVLARAGKSVLVLEKAAVYRDKVRGEWIANWGVEELKTLGLYDDFIAAGGHHLSKHISFGDDMDDPAAEKFEIPLGVLNPGIPGPMTIGHPASCELLSGLAQKAGATVLREINDVAITAGAAPSVTYADASGEHTATCRIIVGADGRGSNVRQQLGVTLDQDPQHHFFSGMLVDGAHAWPDDTQLIGAENDVHYLAFPQGNGRVRLYLGYPTDQPSRLSGEGGQQRFLEAFQLKKCPGSDAFANATPAGPCHSYPNQSASCDTIAVPGAVLIGDAAGYNDPIIGQGLSITYRDVRQVRDALLANEDWSDPTIFAAYAEERAERMRRLRIAANLQSVVESEFGPDAIARRRRVRERQAANPMLQLAQLSSIIGPEKVPDVAFSDETIEQLLA